RAQRLLLGAARGLSAKRREQAEIDVHGLKRASTGIDRLDMVPGNVAEKRAERGRRRRQGRPLAQSFSGGETAGEQSDRRRFTIALAASDLSSKAQPLIGFEPQRRVKKLRRIEDRVAVQPAEPRELST